MSKKAMKMREMRAAKYIAQVTLRRAEASKKMDQVVLRMLAGAGATFAFALVLALVVG